MFKALEKRGGLLCTGIFWAIIVTGRVSGGALKWIIPLACGVTSAVWLWVQDVIRKGRSQEWHAEQLRGQTVWCMQPLGKKP